MATKAKIGILGASGYTGSELVRLLLRHPRAEIALLTADRRAGQEMRSVFPQFSPFDLPTLVSIEGLDWKAQALDLVFCALPHATTQKVLKQSARQGAGHQGRRSVGGFPAERYRRLRELVRARASRAGTCRSEAVYGLAEIHKREIKKARLVANPGCYTTCAQLPLMPLLKNKAIETDGIVIDAKSGMTGAGRAAKEAMLFSEVSEGFHAYGVGDHRHMAELDQEFSLAAGKEVIVSFTPHLVPMNRGILSTIYVQGRRGRTPEELHEILLKFYEKSRLRACAAVRRDAADPACARFQLDLHRRCEGSRAGPRDRHLGARQPGEGRVRSGDPEHEPDARISRDHGDRSDRAVSVSSAQRISDVAMT